MKFKELLNRINQDHKSKKYLGARCPLGPETRLLVLSWLNQPQDDDQLIGILLKIQESGVDKRFAKALYDRLFELVIKSKNELVVVKSLQIIEEVIRHRIANTEHTIWLIDEQRNFNKNSRGYKLGKSVLLCRIYVDSRYSQDIKQAIERWIVKIIDGQDEEYTDLLAFAIGNNEIRIDENIAQKFREYIKQNPLADASAEMAISLAKIKEPFVVTYIVDALGDGPGKPWIDAAYKYRRNPAIKSALAKFETTASEEIKAYIQDMVR